MSPELGVGRRIIYHKMKRLLVIKQTDGIKTDYGTLIYSAKEQISITSHPLDDGYGIEYFIRLDPNQNDVKVASKTELIVRAPGIASASIAPYLYELKFEEPI